MANVSIRYNAKTGQPYVIRVPDNENDPTPPLEPLKGEKVAIVPLKDYLATNSHEEFLRNVPQIAPYYAALDAAKALAEKEVADANAIALAAETT